MQIDVTSRDEAFIVTMRGLEERNGLDLESVAALRRAITGAAAEPENRFLVLQGVPGWFCIGGSGRFMQQTLALADRAARVGAIRRVQALIADLLRCPLFCVALVDGLAAGAGADLVLAADLTLVTPATRFSLLYAKLGLIPDSGFSLLEWRFGHQSLVRFAESKVLSAQDLVQLGLAEPCANPDDLDAIVASLRRRFRFSKPAFAAAKSARNAHLFGDLDGSLDTLAEAQATLLEVPETQARLEHSAAAQRAPPPPSGRLS